MENISSQAGHPSRERWKLATVAVARAAALVTQAMIAMAAALATFFGSIALLAWWTNLIGLVAAGARPVQFAPGPLRYTTTVATQGWRGGRQIVGSQVDSGRKRQTVQTPL